MKKKFMCVIVVGLVFGAVAAVMYLLDCKEAEKQETPAKDTSLANTNIVKEEPLYEDFKSLAIGSMYTRHEDAASIMRGSVKTIYENVKVSENTNNEINQASAELDKMLSED